MTGLFVKLIFYNILGSGDDDYMLREVDIAENVMMV